MKSSRNTKKECNTWNKIQFFKKALSPTPNRQDHHCRTKQRKIFILSLLCVQELANSQQVATELSSRLERQVVEIEELKRSKEELINELEAQKFTVSRTSQF